MKSGLYFRHLGIFLFRKEVVLKRLLGLVCLVAAVMLTAQPRSFADDVISPFIDSQTNAVIHVDFSNLDMDQLSAWQSKAISSISDADARAKAQKQADESFATSKKWVSDFRNAGGKDLYIVISLAGMMQGTSGGIIIPINGADPGALQKVFTVQMPTPDPNDPNAAAMQRMRPQTAVVGNTIVFSTGPGIDKFKAPSAEPRPDLVDGLAAGGTAPVQISLTPSTLKNNPFYKMIVASMMMQHGGQPGQQQQDAPLSEPQWDAVTWVSLSLSLPPKESANCTIQCKDADSATALADLINQKEQAVKDDPTKHGNLSTDDFNKLMAAAKPTVTGTQLVFTLDQDTIDNVLGPMMAKMAQRQATGGPQAQPGQTPPAGGPPPPADNGGNGM
jgi:hypothetical protein